MFGACGGKMLAYRILTFLSTLFPNAGIESSSIPPYTHLLGPDSSATVATAGESNIALMSLMVEPTR